MALNAEQQKLFDKIVTKSFSKLLVLGSGGVGKTYLVCKAISELTRQSVFKMVVCAPTHLARLNITQKLDPDVRHLVETCTVASLLLKFGVDSEDGTVQFTSGKIDRIDKYEIVVLDECSMISQNDYMLLMQSKAKIIFLGDHKQLPPVMAKSCEGKMETHNRTGNLEVFRLTQQMRQKGIILQAAERNRTKPWFPEQSEVGEGGETINVYNTEEELIRSMINNMINDSRGYDSTYHHRYIAYKNVDVRRVGKRIRDATLRSFFGFDASSIPFICHELIMIRENKGTIGYNGELVEIKSVREDKMASNSYPWRSYELTVKGSIGTGMIKAIAPSDYELYEDHFKSLQSKLQHYRIIKDADSAASTLARIKKIRSYWTMVQLPCAITAHKSQGMTIENVYLNTSSFVSAPNRRALLYVGISRAAKSLHTVKVEGKESLNRTEVNERYREARAVFEMLTGDSYRTVTRRLGIPTSSLEGKYAVAQYLEYLAEDLKQEKEEV